MVVWVDALYVYVFGEFVTQTRAARAMDEASQGAWAGVGGGLAAELQGGGPVGYSPWIARHRARRMLGASPLFGLSRSAN